MGMKTLAEFMASSHTNTWLELDNMVVYVRKGRHAFNGVLIDTIDIANVCVDDECQNQGIFTQFLEDVELSGLPIHIENVLSKRFADFFRKRGYDTVFKRYDVTSFLKQQVDN